MPSAKKKNGPKTGTPHSEISTNNVAAPAKDRLARKTLYRAKAKKPPATEKRPASEVGSHHTRMPVDEALRAAGLGEQRFAETLELFIRRVSATNGEEKLLLDGMKEWGRHLERARPTERATDPPVFVHLVHNVPRPQRPPRPELGPAPPVPETPVQ